MSKWTDGRGCKRCSSATWGKWRSCGWAPEEKSSVNQEDGWRPIEVEVAVEEEADYCQRLEEMLWSDAEYWNEHNGELEGAKRSKMANAAVANAWPNLEGEIIFGRRKTKRKEEFHPKAGNRAKKKDEQRQRYVDTEEELSRTKLTQKNIDKFWSKLDSDMEKDVLKRYCLKKKVSIKEEVNPCSGFIEKRDKERKTLNGLKTKNEWGPCSRSLVESADNAPGKAGTQSMMVKREGIPQAL